MGVHPYRLFLPRYSITDTGHSIIGAKYPSRDSPHDSISGVRYILSVLSPPTSAALFHVRPSHQPLTRRADINDGGLGCSLGTNTFWPTGGLGRPNCCRRPYCCCRLGHTVPGPVLGVCGLLRYCRSAYNKLHTPTSTFTSPSHATSTSARRDAINLATFECGAHEYSLSFLRGVGRDIIADRRKTEC